MFVLRIIDTIIDIADKVDHHNNDQNDKKDEDNNHNIKITIGITRASIITINLT